MSNLVFVSGDFCSGSTLMFTLFRKTQRYHCLYEFLHENLDEFLIYWLRPDESDHHFFVDAYHREYKGFDCIPQLWNPAWGISGFELRADARDDALYRYISYLIGASFGRCPNVMLKENRITFKLGWIRANFPAARIVHIHRRKEDQWKSIVRRVQAAYGREDVGQSRPDFRGFNIAGWCDDLSGTYPVLAAGNFKSGFERFSALWELSYAENRKYADISIDYDELTKNFDLTAERLWAGIGARDIDTPALRKYVIRSEAKEAMPHPFQGALGLLAHLKDRVGRRYAALRVRYGSRPRPHAT